MHGQDFFQQALVYLAAAVISVPIARRLGLGSVLGYLIAGILIGPFALALVGKEGQDVMHFAEFGVVMMLFIVGLELRPSLLWRMRGPLLGMGSLQVLVSAAAIMLVALLAGIVWKSALAIGLILALSSTAIALQILAEKDLMRSVAGQGAFSVLLFQDLAVIPMLAVLPLLAISAPAAATDGHVNWVSGLPGWAQTLVVLGSVAGIVLAGRFLARHVFRFIARTGLREVFTAAALLLVIGIAVLMSQVGLSPALGTFVAGVVLAESEYRHELESDLEPFKGLLLGLFFIAVGASIDFRLIADRPGMIAALVVGLVLVKMGVLAPLGKLFGMRTSQNLTFVFSLSQGGEFAFVLFSFAGANGVLTRDIIGPLTAAVAITMALTPLFFLLNEKVIMPRLLPASEEPEADVVDEGNPVIIVGFGRFGNVVGRFLRARGVGATVLDTDADRVEVLRKLGIKVYYGDASRLDLLHTAGIAHARILILTQADTDKIVEIAETVRKHFPHVKILARAAGRFAAYKLLDAPIDYVYRDTLDTSLKLGVQALRLLGFRAYQAERAARTFRQHDEIALRELAPMRHDKTNYFSTARQRIADLEELLQSEQAGDDGSRDLGWDTTTLRADFGGRGSTSETSPGPDKNESGSTGI